MCVHIFSLLLELFWAGIGGWRWEGMKGKRTKGLKDLPLARITDIFEMRKI